jgi:hypothetical protein
MTRSLFDISDDLLALEEILSQVGGEITDDDAGQALERFFNELGAERDQKLDNYGALIRELESRAAGRAEEVTRLEALIASDNNNVKRLKRRLKAFFEIHQIKKLDTRRFRFSVQANGGALPLIMPEEWERDPASAPEAFHRARIELDKEAIREAIKNDEETHGAQLGERGNHLRIR